MSDDANDLLGSNLGPAPEAVKPKRAAKGMPDRVWIQLEESDDMPPTGLFISVNGVGYLMRAGEPVHAPKSVIEVLDHAITTMPVTDPTTKRVIGHRERMRFPYRRVDAPAEAS